MSARYILNVKNDLLKAELAVLRANPVPDDGARSSEARSQIQELTLALRRLSQKIESTDDALLSKTTELIHAQGGDSQGKGSCRGRVRARRARARKGRSSVGAGAGAAE